MKFFQGDISSAINLAKSKNAIFVVYCEGKQSISLKSFKKIIFFITIGKDDENSKLMTSLINTHSITAKLESDEFVVIRIESDKPEYLQFCKICKNLFDLYLLEKDT